MKVYDSVRPPRWLLAHDGLPWQEVIDQHAVENADVLDRLSLGGLGELLLYAGARGAKQRRERCLLAAEAFRTARESAELGDALRALFRACETTDDAQSAWLNLTLRRKFGSPIVLVPLVEVAVSRGEPWITEAAEILSADARKLSSDPDGWLHVVREVRSSGMDEVRTVLQHAFPDTSADDAQREWLDLLRTINPEKAEDEASSMALQWLKGDADRSLAGARAVDAVAGLLEQSENPIHRHFAERVRAMCPGDSKTQVTAAPDRGA